MFGVVYILSDYPTETTGNYIHYSPTNLCPVKRISLYGYNKHTHQAICQEWDTIPR